MIEAQCEWTLEGPSDSITFNDGGVWTLTEKPRTSVDDRRDTYDYPLDDGGHVGAAYAGMRAWSLRGLLAASTHAERNTELQRLNAILNSLRREDGLLKWQAAGFPAVQSSVRRMGSVDYSGGANLHVPVTFGLLSGDPRVYSQAESSDSVGAGSATVGANLMSTNQASIETDANDWTVGPNFTASRSTAQAHAGTASLRVVSASGIVNPISATSTSVSVAANDIVRVSGWVRSDVDASARLGVTAYTSADAYAGSTAPASPTAYVTIPANTWTQISSDDISLPAGTSYVKVFLQCSATGGLGYSTTSGLYLDDVAVNGVTYSANVSVTNEGDASSAPIYTVTGPVTNPKIINSDENENLTLSATIAAATTLTVDAAAREIYTGAALDDASNLYSAKPASSPFPLLYPGANTMVFQGGGTDANSALEVRWRDAWMP